MRQNYRIVLLFSARPAQAGGNRWDALAWRETRILRGHHCLSILVAGGGSNPAARKTEGLLDQLADGDATLAGGLVGGVR